MVNTLFVGSDDFTADIRGRLERPYLLIADRKPVGIRGQVFDYEKHGIDLLRGMNYRRACDFVSLIDAAFPEGATTLTRKNATFELFTALLDKPISLETLIPEGDDPALRDARQKIERLLMSPVLNKVLGGTVHLDMSGNVIAVLDRKKIGDFDAFFLAHVLISKFDGLVIIPDFGFYGRDYLEYLAREERLICGVRALDELSQKLRQAVLLFPDKVARHCTADDAEVLASYAGKVRGTQGYTDFVAELIA